SHKVSRLSSSGPRGRQRIKPLSWWKSRRRRSEEHAKEVAAKVHEILPAPVVLTGTPLRRLDSLWAGNSQDSPGGLSQPLVFLKFATHLASPSTKWINADPHQERDAPGSRNRRHILPRNGLPRSGLRGDARTPPVGPVGGRTDGGLGATVLRVVPHVLLLPV